MNNQLDAPIIYIIACALSETPEKELLLSCSQVQLFKH